MDIKQWAERLNEREYRVELTNGEEEQAKKDGVVIVFGASDDLMEFRGVISDEVGAYEGGTAFVSSEGLFDLNHDCPEGGQNTIDFCQYLQNKRDACIQIKAIWEPKLMDGASWLIEAPDTLPHEHFDIMEDGELYCRGLVFRLADVKPAGDNLAAELVAALEMALEFIGSLPVEVETVPGRGCKLKGDPMAVCRVAETIKAAIAKAKL